VSTGSQADHEFGFQIPGIRLPASLGKPYYAGHVAFGYARQGSERTKTGKISVGAALSRDY